jgi:hypothetical protein
MNVKEIWSEEDFEDMGWHDSYIHAISFPNDCLQLSLDIDYIFKWVLDDKTNLYNFWVSPCNLIFRDTLNLEINLNFKNAIGLSIQDINKSNFRLSPNGEIGMWDFEILTDRGNIKFESSGFRQIVKAQPKFLQNQTIERE